MSVESALKRLIVVLLALVILTAIYVLYRRQTVHRLNVEPSAAEQIEKAKER